MAVESKYYEILEVETDASDHEIKRVQLTPFFSFTVKNE
jgi:curved DNA-binding protein CbpA